MSEPPKIFNMTNASGSLEEEKKQLEPIDPPPLKKIGTANPHISVNQLYQQTD